MLSSPKLKLDGTPRKRPVRKGRNGRVLDEDFYVRMKSYYMRGMALKLIAAVMNCSISTVSTARRDRAWPMRQQPRGATPQKRGSRRGNKRRIELWLTLDTLNQIDARIYGEYSTRNTYLRALITNDLTWNKSMDKKRKQT